MVDWELLKQASLQAVSGGLTPQILAWGLRSGYEGMPVGFRPASHLSQNVPLWRDRPSCATCVETRQSSAT